MFIKYNPKHPHIKVVPIVNGDGLSVAAESVTLNPGTNEVSDDKWEKIKASLASEIADGTVKPFSVKAQNSGHQVNAKTLKDVPAAVAAKIIAECSNKDTLRAWFKENLSDELALLVIGRMRTLNMDLDVIADEGETLSDADIVDESKTFSAPVTKKDDAENGKTTEPQTSATKPETDGKSQGGNGGKAGAAPAKSSEVKDDKKVNAEKGDEIPDFDNPDVKVK